MKAILTIAIFTILAHVSYGEPSELLYQSLIDFYNTLPQEQKSELNLPTTVSDLPKELMPIFEVTEKEKTLVEVT